jgi:hypothetical protein
MKNTYTVKAEREVRKDDVIYLSGEEVELSDREFAYHRQSVDEPEVEAVKPVVKAKSNEKV